MNPTFDRQCQVVICITNPSVKGMGHRRGQQCRHACMYKLAGLVQVHLSKSNNVSATKMRYAIRSDRPTRCSVSPVTGIVQRYTRRRRTNELSKAPHHVGQGVRAEGVSVRRPGVAESSDVVRLLQHQAMLYVRSVIEIPQSAVQCRGHAAPPPRSHLRTQLEA